MECQLTFTAADRNAITLLDGAALGNSDSLTLTVAHGTLKLGSTAGLIFSGAPNGSAKFTVTGTLVNLNAGLNGLATRQPPITRARKCCRCYSRIRKTTCPVRPP